MHFVHLFLFITQLMNNHGKHSYISKEDLRKTNKINAERKESYTVC